MSDWSGWAVALLNRMGAPPSRSNLQFLQAWHAGEQSAAAYNPLNTTWGMPGAGSINSVGVRSYTSPQQGLTATYKTLMGNRGYDPIVQGLRAGNLAPAELARRVVASPWGTHSFPTLGVSGGSSGGTNPALVTSQVVPARTVAPTQMTRPRPPSVMPFISGIIAGLQHPDQRSALMMQGLAGMRQNTDAYIQQLQAAAATAQQAAASGAPSGAATATPTSGGSPADMGYAPGPRGPSGVEQSLLDLAKQYGLQITSGYRSVAKQAELYAGRSGPGTVAAPGKSYHNFGRAIDVAPSSQLMSLVNYVKAHPGEFREFFYDPLGWYVKNGTVYKGAIGGHSNHAHIAI